MKTKTTYTKGIFSYQDLSLGITLLVFLVQLTVGITSCFIWAVNVQEFTANSTLPNVLEWLQTWDGVGRKTKRSHFTRPETVSWNKTKALLQLTTFLEWCSLHYFSSLVFCFISQAFLVVMIRGKWLSVTKKLSLSCLLWVVLLINARKRAPLFRLLNVLLSGFTCCICLYLFLMCSVGNRFFGQIKNRKKTPKLETRGDNDEEEDVHQTTANFVGKLKLPEELVFAEERYSLNKNVGCLSLGPPDCNKRKQNEAMGSWFCSNLRKTTVEPNIVRDTESVIGNALIWPAKFHLNGTSLSQLHSRKKGNGKPEPKKNASQDKSAEFSDNEFATFPEDNTVKRTRPDRQEVKQDRGRGTDARTTSFKNCNVLHVILVCSLALNLWLVSWFFKDFIRKALFKT